jgi:predicted DNA-binding transcriptional regulator AlpA
VIRIVPEVQSDGRETDEWWTTEKVCAFLKLGRKAIWERRRNPVFAFPKPANLGGGRNHYRASAIRLWAERMALASMLED